MTRTELVKAALAFWAAIVNHVLAHAWRITQAQSRFTFQPGQSTATLTNCAFPGKDPDRSIATHRAAAEKYCRDVGVTDQHLLDDCVLDLAVTNDFVFGSDDAHAQHVLAARLTLRKPSLLLGSIVDDDPNKAIVWGRCVRRAQNSWNPGIFSIAQFALATPRS